MKIKIDLADNFIDVWNEEKEKWERYVKVELEEEKEIPEKLDLHEDLQDILNSNDESIILNAIHKCLICEKIKINKIIDYLKSKGE